jgi:hypothetical protein
VDKYEVTREDAMVFGGGIVLLIGLFSFPWYSISFGPFGTLDRSATDSPYDVWGILAVIVLILIVLDLAFARFSPRTHIPTTQLGRDMTRVAACGVLLLLLFIKFLANVGSFGWGFYIDVILALVASAGCWLIAQGHSTPLLSAAGGSGTRS